MLNGFNYKKFIGIIGFFYYIIVSVKWYA